jgi:hypothetical protein
MYQFSPGATSTGIQYLIRDAITGQPKTGLSASTPGAVAGYTRQNGSAVAIPIVALGSPLSVWTAGGFVEIDSVLAQGVYRFDAPDAAFAVGAAFVTLTIDIPGALGEGVLILLQNSFNNVGPGAFQYAVTLQTVASAPIQGGSLWVSTDPGGTNVVAGSLTTSAAGIATFLLGNGTYYLWVNAAGYTPVNPTAFTVSGSGGQTLALVAATAPPSLTPAQGHEPATTAYDLVERLLDFVGADADDKNYRATRRAALDAMREYATIHRWTSLRQFGRLAINGAYSGNGVGTVQYQGSSGTYANQITLTGDSFPSWAASGYIRIGVVVAKVDRLVSSTILTLKDPMFVVDMPAGQAFTLYQDTYTLPSDFVFTNDAMAETTWGTLSYMTYEQWGGRVRFGQGISTPRFWTIAGSPDFPGRLAMLLYPSPDASGTLDYMYYRRPRQVVNFDINTGTVSVSTGNANLATFSTPVLNASMKGSILRMAADATGPPTGLDGLEVYAYEGSIVSVISPTQAMMDSPGPATPTGVSFRISDPIDIQDLHQTLIARTAERNLATSRIMSKQMPAANAAWNQALVLAQEGDSRVSARRAEGRSGIGRARLANMPIVWAE